MSAKISFVGGDDRFLYAAEFLSDEYGAECTISGFGNIPAKGKTTRVENPYEAVMSADAVILPIPVSADGLHINAPLSEEPILLAPFIAAVKKETVILGGKTEKISEIHKNTLDYGQREEFAILNSVPTAEGAILSASQKLQRTVYGLKAVVLGYGKVGKTLSDRLKKWGADVTVFARKEGDIATAESNGIRARNYGYIKAVLPDTDCVFNTVPSVILTDEILSVVDRRTILVELASKPGGIDRTAAEKYGIAVVDAPGIPGKLYPLCAGNIIARVCAECMEGIL